MGVVSFIFELLPSLVQMILQQAIVLNVAKVDWKVKRLVATVTIIFAINVLSLFLLSKYEVAFQIVWVVLLVCSYRISYKQSFRKSVLMGLGQMIFNSLIEYVGVFIITLVAGDRQAEIFEKIVLIRIVYIFVFYVLYLFSRKFIINVDKMEAKSLNLWLVYLIFVYFFIDPVLLRMEENLPINQTLIVNMTELYNVALVIVFLCYNIYHINSLRKSASISQQLEVQQLYAGSLEKSVNQLRGFKHDFANIMSSINGLALKGDLPVLTAYVQQLNTEILTIKTTDIVNSDLKNFKILYGVVLSKVNTAELSGVAFEISIQDDIQLRYCSPVDISRMVGILLDNALESAAESDEKYVDFEIKNDRERSVFTICNSCSEAVDIGVIAGEGYTTKEDHSGQGLHQIELIRKKYQRMGFSIKLHTEYSNHEFKQTLMI